MKYYEIFPLLSFISAYCGVQKTHSPSYKVFFFMVYKPTNIHALGI
jgi:hypothetical protein